MHSGLQVKVAAVGNEGVGVTIERQQGPLEQKDIPFEVFQKYYRKISGSEDFLECARPEPGRYEERGSPPPLETADSGADTSNVLIYRSKSAWEPLQDPFAFLRNSVNGCRCLGNLPCWMRNETCKEERAEKVSRDTFSAAG